MNGDDLHDERGFRMRGRQPTRVNAFVDAAFAFAVTLRVVAVGHIPTSGPELGLALRGVPAFAASFMLIAIAALSLPIAVMLPFVRVSPAFPALPGLTCLPILVARTEHAQRERSALAQLAPTAVR